MIEYSNFIQLVLFKTEINKVIRNSKCYIHEVIVIIVGIYHLTKIINKMNTF